MGQFIFALFCIVFGVSIVVTKKEQLLYILMKGRSYKDEEKLIYMDKLIIVFRILGGLLACVGLYIGVLTGLTLVMRVG